MSHGEMPHGIFWDLVYERVHEGQRLGQAMSNVLSGAGLMPAYFLGTAADPYYTVTTEWEASAWVGTYATILNGMIVRIGD